MTLSDVQMVDIGEERFAPQCGQAFAEVLISLLHSLHVIKAIWRIR